MMTFYTSAKKAGYSTRRYSRQSSGNDFKNGGSQAGGGKKAQEEARSVIITLTPPEEHLDHREQDRPDRVAGNHRGDLVRQHHHGHEERRREGSLRGTARGVGDALQP
jgi:hypothetical protein